MPNSTHQNSLLKLPKLAFHKEMGDHILENPEEIFRQYQELLAVMSETKRPIRNREISIIYRKHFGKGKPLISNSGDLTSVSFLAEKYHLGNPIQTVQELEIIAVELGGVKKPHEDATTTLRSASIQTIAETTKSKARQTSSPSSAKDDKSLNDWIVKEINKTN